MKEIWKAIQGYELLYEVSNIGRVRSLDRYDRRNILWKGKILSQVKDKDGYLFVHISVNCVGKNLWVHRLVAQAFIPNPLGLPQVNHKDEDKTNNSVDNLEWCDCKYNMNYGTKNKRAVDTKIEKGICWSGLSKKELGIKEYTRKLKLLKNIG